MTPLKTTVFIFLMLIAVRPHAGERIDSCPPFGRVHLYTPADTITSVTLFISGDGCWNPGVANMATITAGTKSLVIGIDICRYLRHLNASSAACLYPPGDFENLSRYIQQKTGLPSYIPPVIIGYSSGATLAYALLCHAPPGTFRGAISMGFCPDLPIIKPLCRQNSLKWTSIPNGKGILFQPVPELKTPWIVFQGKSDEVCSSSTAQKFALQTGSSQYIELPGVGHGFSVEKNWVPRFKTAFLNLTASAPELLPPPRSADVGNLPLVEIPAKAAQRDLFAVILSGDGGWAGIDKGIAEVLSNEGIPVAGFNSLQYFWKPRTPEEAAADLDKIINHYCVLWGKKRALVIGYSFGGDVLPFMASRLPAATAERVALLAFLGLSSRTDFRFHLTDWIGGRTPPTARPVLPEIEKLKGRPMVYIYGTDEKDNLAASIDHKAVNVIAFKGGHHFDGNYQVLTDSILAYIK